MPSSFKMALDPRNKVPYMNPAIVERVHELGKHFMNRGHEKLGILGKSALDVMQFHNFYGAPAIAVLDAWNQLISHALVQKEDESLTHAGHKCT